MTVTAVGDNGLLDLEFVTDRRGRTRLGAHRQRFPQRITAPMRADPYRAGTAFVCTQNPTGGVFAGECLRTSVIVRTGASVQLTTQSATQLYPGESRHGVEFRISDGAVLEHLPWQLVPHRGARHRQSILLRLSGDAVYLGWDVLGPGRVGHGEQFAYDALELHTTVEVDGVATARETLRLAPSDRKGPTMDTPGVLGRYQYVASMLLLAPRRRLDDLRSELAAGSVLEGPVLGGVSTLPGNAGLLIRLLGARVDEVHTTLHAVWDRARVALLGVPAFRLRR